MRRIKEVILDGFKGICRSYNLSPATILSGDNGTGKSACREAIIYALTGDLPTGRHTDIAKKYFQDRGGSVTVQDTDGRWIKRGITIDHKTAKVSTHLSTSDTGDGALDLSNWQVSKVVLNVEEFTDLSPELMREYILKLCGSGKPVSNLIEEIADRYAKSIAGPAATRETLKDPSIFEVGSDEWLLAVAFSNSRGIQETLDSYLTKESLSANCIKLGEVAKTEKNRARKNAQDAEAAIQELEADAKGARAAAEELQARRYEVDTIREELAACRAKQERMDEVRSRVKYSEIKIKELTIACKNANEQIEKLQEPGNRPVIANSTNGELRKADKEHRKVVEDLNKLNVELSSEKQCRNHVEFIEKRFNDAVAYSKSLKGSGPIPELVLLVSEIPDDVHKNILPLKRVVNEVSLDWTKACSDAESDCCRQRKVLDKARKDFNPNRMNELMAQIETVSGSEEKLRGEVKRLHADMVTQERQHKETLERWELECKRWNDAEHAVDRTSRDLKQAQVDLSAAIKRLEEINGDGGPLQEEIESRLFLAIEDEEKAGAAAGSLEMYENAIQRCTEYGILTKAWNHTERAIQGARESLVSSATKPLEKDINEILQSVGRQERVYLRLENDRGKKDFQFGWSVAGVRVPLSSMSAGETVIFCASLSIALIQRSPGRRMLMIEADPLDRKNIEALLNALGPQSDQLECLMVATAQEGWRASDGWEVIRL